MVSYEVFGKFYDAAIGERTPMATYIRKLIKNTHPHAKSLLELACGTGVILKSLSDLYNVTGLDISSIMLSIANKRLPNTSLYRVNMVNFNFNCRFDVIICVFDSINHVLSFADWRKLFSRVHSHLNDEGIFLFDINTEWMLKKYIEDSPCVYYFGNSLRVVDASDAGRGVTNFNIKIFEHQKGNSFKLFEEDIKEKSFPVGKIKEMLLKKFEKVRVADPNRKRPAQNSERLYFVCHK